MQRVNARYGHQGRSSTAFLRWALIHDGSISVKICKDADSVRHLTERGDGVAVACKAETLKSNVRMESNPRLE
jgi:hypothetical protein